MFRRLLRLVRNLLPACIVAATWVVWCASPERPLREWRLEGAFGFINGELVFEENYTEFCTATRPSHPSVYKRRLSLINSATGTSTRFLMGDWGEVTDWRLDLKTGDFTRIPHWERRHLHHGISMLIQGDDDESRDHHWRAVGEERSDGKPDVHRFLKQWIGWDGKKTLDLHLCIFDTTTDRMINDVPAWEVARWTDDDQFWTVDTIYTFKGVPAGVTVRLWSVYAAPPPWWLWSLTIAGIVWYAHRIWRRVAGAESAMPR